MPFNVTNQRQFRALTAMARRTPIKTDKSFTRFLGRAILGSTPGPHPGFVAPELATLRSQVPTKGEWLFEIKFDGYRLQAQLQGGRPRIFTRNGLDWSNKFSRLADAVAGLPARQLVVDGEMVSQDEQGRPNFSQLQADISSGRQNRMAYYAFDLLYLDGFDLRKAPLVERKRVLQAFLQESNPSGIFYSEHYTVDGKSMFASACKNKLEGLIAKKADSIYKSARSEDWLKIKCTMTEKFVIVGYVPGGHSGELGALRLARKRGKELVYVGKTGTGFNQKNLSTLLLKLRRLEVAEPALQMPVRNRDTKWVEPKLMAQIEYRDLTEDGYVRHSSFKGLA